MSNSILAYSNPIKSSMDEFRLQVVLGYSETRIFQEKTRKGKYFFKRLIVVGNNCRIKSENMLPLEEKVAKVARFFPWHFFRVTFSSFNNAKKVGGLIWPRDFSKSVSPKEKVKPRLLVTFNIIINKIFPENFIDISQVVLKIWIYLPILAIFIDFHRFFLDFLTFPCYKETN